MTSAQLEMILAKTVSLLTSKIIEAARKDCPGHHFTCPLLHQCEQQSLLDKFNIYFPGARDEIMANPETLIKGENGMEGKVAYISSFLASATPSSIYFGSYYLAHHDKRIPKTKPACPALPTRSERTGAARQKPAKRRRVKKDILSRVLDDIDLTMKDTSG